MLKAIQKSFGNSKLAGSSNSPASSPVIRPSQTSEKRVGAPYSDDDLESNTSSQASSQSAATFYSALTHLSDTSDPFDRQSLHSNAEDDASTEIEIRELVEDPKMLTRLRQISLSLDRKKKFKESLELLSEFHQAVDHFLPIDHIHGIKIQSYIADHYIGRKMFSKAELHLGKCCTGKARKLGPSDASTIKSNIKHAAVLQIQGNIDDCESTLSDCLAACLDAPSPHVSQTIDLENLKPHADLSSDEACGRGCRGTGKYSY